MLRLSGISQQAADLGHPEGRRHSARQAQEMGGPWRPFGVDDSTATARASGKDVRNGVDYSKNSTQGKVFPAG
eukprot:1452671-Pyramimonas_sp.AAC.1